MAELTPQERLQPSLLDRLTDDDPEKGLESRERRILNIRKLREVVLRDLGWLFNAGNHHTPGEFAEFPEAAGSVINYGMPDFAGLCASNIDTRELERLVRQAIWDFEPRILRDSVRVRTMKRNEMSLNALTFEIEGELWAQPVPFHLFLKTQVDLETGSVSVVEQGGSGAA
jgi:type VI secretion system protein ImpF